MSEDNPQRIGPYTVVARLGLGGQGRVVRADGPNGPVALKLARTPAQRVPLLNEAKALQQAAGPGVVRLIEHDPKGEWLALELLQGVPFDGWAQSKTLDAVALAGARLASILARLHEAGVVHGDLTPQNVMMVGDHPVLLDFGLTGAVVEPGTFLGTLGYAAPELLRGQPATPATDLYGLGAVLYAAVTGQPPFAQADAAALAYLPLVSSPLPPSSLRNDLSVTFNQLLLGLLARQPSRRPSSAQKVIPLVQRASSGGPVKVVVGMDRVREPLRQAVGRAADGEPTAVVVYGPPGSGRRTLLSEAVEAARREGMDWIKGGDPAVALQELRAKTGLKVAVVRAGSRGLKTLLAALPAEKLPGLVLVHAERPLVHDGELLQLTPPPLEESDVERLCRIQGTDPAESEAIRRRTQGHPASVLGALRAWHRARLGTPVQPELLSAEQRSVLSALEQAPERQLTVAELARRLQMDELTLLDHAEALFAEELVREVDLGRALALTP